MRYLCIVHFHNIVLRSIHHSHHICTFRCHTYLSSQYTLHLIHIYKYFHDKYPMRQSNCHSFGTLKMIYTVLVGSFGEWYYVLVPVDLLIMIYTVNARSLREWKTVLVPVELLIMIYTDNAGRVRQWTTEYVQ